MDSTKTPTIVPPSNEEEMSSPPEKLAGHVDSTKKHIRGSSLLLFGRLVSLGLNFLVQVLTVRYLSKSDYGAFAYALSIVSMGASISLFGLDKAIARFLPIYHEKDRIDKLFGTLLMAAGTVLGVGGVLILLFVGLRGVLTETVINDPLSATLLLTLIALSPMQAYDSLGQGILAVFARPSAIFFRRHVLGPALRLAAVLAVILAGSGVHLLSVGYLVGGLIGTIVYGVMIFHLLREQGLFQKLNWKKLTLPAREVYSFSVPLLSTDLLLILKSTVVVIFLEYFRGTTDVAEFRAVLPVAGLNLVVFQSFKYLFTPVAARLFAREDQVGINELYWKTAIWITVISFPIFAVTFSLAKPLTVLLFSARYAQSGIVLAILAVGNYFNAALGFNSYTLRVYGRVRYIVAIDILSMIIGVALDLWLIPRYGAVGAALGTSAALIIYNILNHVGLLLGTGIELFHWRYLRVYLTIIVSSIGLLLLQGTADPPIYISVVLVALVSAILIRIHRHTLNILEMFPELERIPFLRPLLGL